MAKEQSLRKTIAFLEATDALPGLTGYTRARVRRALDRNLVALTQLIESRSDPGDKAKPLGRQP